MTIDPENLKNGVFALKDILQKAHEIRLFVYNNQNDDVEDMVQTEQSIQLEKLNELTLELEQCNWNIKDYFDYIATKNCNEYRKRLADLIIVDGWENLVNEKLGELDVK